MKLGRKREKIFDPHGHMWRKFVRGKEVERR